MMAKHVHIHMHDEPERKFGRLPPAPGSTILQRERDSDLIGSVGNRSVRAGNDEIKHDPSNGQFASSGGPGDPGKTKKTGNKTALAKSIKNSKTPAVYAEGWKPGQSQKSESKKEEPKKPPTPQKPPVHVETPSREKGPSLLHTATGAVKKLENFVQKGTNLTERHRPSSIDSKLQRLHERRTGHKDCNCIK